MSRSSLPRPSMSSPFRLEQRIVIAFSILFLVSLALLAAAGVR